MKSVQLGYKAFDLHELTCHFVAQQAGIYAARGLEVCLLDTRFTPDHELPEALFSVACGAALVRWLRGEEMKVVFVAADKPMFLLCTRSKIGSVSDLRGGRIAAYPAAAPPAYILRIVLADAGLDPDNDVHIAPVPDDAARLKLLESGAADAAVLSSATLPFRAAELGYGKLLYFGDEIRIPTTGLAVSLSMFKGDPQGVAAMRDSFREAIRLVHSDAALLRRALGLALITDDREIDIACDLVREYYTPDGLIDAADITPCVKRLAVSMDLAVPDEAWALYDCTLRID